MLDEAQRFQEEQNEDLQQDKMQLEINKRVKVAEQAIYKRFKQIFQKPTESLSEDDKAFLRARVSYLTRGQRAEYAEVLVLPSEVKPGNVGEVPLMEKSRKQLDNMAREAGVKNPEDLASKEKVIEAMQALQ
mgnify:CR=1 FL=1